jgi:hypothetical protein
MVVQLDFSINDEAQWGRSLFSLLTFVLCNHSIFLSLSIHCVDIAHETKCSVVYIIINNCKSCRETTKAGGLYRDWV